ncbi:MAG: hypothetical protein AB7N71_02675 [Phycisphaerae bacterium]
MRGAVAGRALFSILFVLIGQLAFADDSSLTAHAAWRYEADSNVLWARQAGSGTSAHIIAATERGELIFLDAQSGTVREKYLLGPIPDSDAVVAISRSDEGNSSTRYAAVLPTRVAFLDFGKSRDTPAFYSDLLVQPRLVDDPEFLDRLHPSAALDDGLVVATREGAAYRLRLDDGTVAAQWPIPRVARARLMSFDGNVCMMFAHSGGFRIVDISQPLAVAAMRVLFASEQRDPLHSFAKDDQCRVIFRDRLVTVSSSGAAAFDFPAGWHTRSAWVATQSRSPAPANPGGVAIVLVFERSAQSGANVSEAADVVHPQGILAFWSCEHAPVWQRDVAIDDETHIEVVGDAVAILSKQTFEMFATRDGKCLQRGARASYPLVVAQATGFAIDKRVVLGFAGRIKE